MSSEYNLKVLSKYISTWGWNLISVINFSVLIILFSLPHNNLSFIFGVVYIFMFISSIIITIKRQKEFYTELENENNNN